MRPPVQSDRFRTDRNQAFTEFMVRKSVSFEMKRTLGPVPAASFIICAVRMSAADLSSGFS